MEPTQCRPGLQAGGGDLSEADLSKAVLATPVEPVDGPRRVRFVRLCNLTLVSNTTEAAEAERPHMTPADKESRICAHEALVWRTLDTCRAGVVGVAVTIAPLGSANRQPRVRHVSAPDSDLRGGQRVRLAGRQPPRRHGQQRRGARRSGGQSDMVLDSRNVPFE